MVINDFTIHLAILKCLKTQKYRQEKNNATKRSKRKKKLSVFIHLIM